MLDFKRKQLLSAIGGLDCASKRRLHHYRSHLASDKDPMIFDDRMKDMLVQLVAKPKEFLDTVKYLDSIGFTQSRYEFQKIREQLEKFTGSNHKYYGWNRHFQSAKEALIREVTPWKCSVVQYSSYNIGQYIPKHSTHAGWSYVTTGLRRKGEYVDGMFDSYMVEQEAAVKNGTFAKPILIGARTQASGAFDPHSGERTGTFKAKTRLVSMIDINVIMAERRFQYPIQRFLSSTNWYAGGKNDIDIAGMVNWGRNTYGNWVSIDYSSYDQSISDWLIHEAFDVIKAMFFKISDEDMRVFEVIKHDFISKMFVSEKGVQVFSEKGVPSGSMFTQIIDSIVNRLMIDCYLNSIDVKDRRMIIMGDDNVIFCREKIDLEHLSTYLQHNFGVEVNASKSSAGGYRDDVEFLSRVWSSRIFRSPNVLISKLCYPEHFREYDQLDATPLTIIMQYYENFPGGMELFLNTEKLRKLLSSERPCVGKDDYRLMSGLARYRAMFDRRVTYH